MPLSTYTNALAALDAIPPDDDGGAWELVTSAGLAAASDIEDGKFIVGRIACRVKTRYGEDTLGKFAYAIKLEKSRVAEYRTVCAFWPDHIIDLYRSEYPNVPYTIYREAMRLKRDGQEECSQVEMDFIRQAADEDWSVEDARREIAARAGKPEREWIKVGELLCTAEIMPDGSIRLQPMETPADQLLLELEAGALKVVIHGKTELEHDSERTTIAALRAAGVGFGAVRADSPRETGSHVPVGQDPAPAKRVGKRRSNRQPGSATTLAAAGD
jgi:hypothetical protein